MDNYAAEAHRNTIDEETAHYTACVNTATARGHEIEQAEQCEDGDLGCAGCPLRGK